jgi:hypothetical protein
MKMLKENVSDDVLKYVLTEANGEGVEGWCNGVSIEYFEGVVRKAVVFG